MRSYIQDFLPPILYRTLKDWRRKFFHSGSTGTNKLDLKLIDEIKPKFGRGYFVELGANDGFSQSNTYLLQEKFQWTGLLIEPNPQLFKECIRSRSFGNKPTIKCNACVSNDFKDKFIEIIDVNLMSIALGLDVNEKDAEIHSRKGLKFLQNIDFKCNYGALAATLTSLLEEADAPMCFDLLSLDVEGNELSVLKGLNFNIYRPRWILAETRKDDAVKTYLERKGYILHKIIADYPPNRDDCLFKLL